MRTRSLLPLLALAACTGDPARPPPDDTAAAGDDTGGGDTGVAAEGCRATPRAADRDRVVLVSLPIDEDLNRVPVWAELSLDASGALIDTGGRLTLGPALSGAMAWTPDGSIGLMPLEDGTIGVVSVDEAGAVAVVQDGFDPGAYITDIRVDPSGERAYLVNPNWPDSGGGLYVADIDCDTGALGAATRIAEAKNPAAVRLVPGSTDRAVLVGREIPGAGGGADAALVSTPDGAVLDGDDAFGDEDAFVAGVGLTSDGWLLIGDNNEFSGLPNRVAAVRVSGDQLEATVVVDDVFDPVAIVPNPIGPGALVASGYGDRYLLLGQDDDGAVPWFIAGQVQEAGQEGVQLPNAAVAVTRGPLAGTVLAVEVGGIRTLTFDPTGGATLGGVVSFPGTYASIPGAIGLQP